MMDEKNTYIDVLGAIESCTRGGEPIGLSLMERLEIQVLIKGGVQFSHFEIAIETWVNTKRYIESDFGYIKWVALRKAAEALFEVKNA